jgi:hypothetical protein
MKTILTLCVLLVHVASAFAGTPAAKAATTLPNILVILADDMGFSDLGCYGSEIPTPHLDSLAAGGVKFKQFYNNARCCPTRASLLTGLFPHQTGIGHMAGQDTGLPGYLGHLNERCLTIAQWLQPAGYYTAMTGKWHVGGETGSNPWERGFQRSVNSTLGGFYFPDGPRAKLFEDGKPIAPRGGSLPQDWYSSDLFSLLCQRFVGEARAAGKPFFIYLPFEAIVMTHRNVRYQDESLRHSDPTYDVNKWDFVYDFDIKGLGEIIVALAGDLKAPDRGVHSTQREPLDPTIVTDRFGNRFRYEPYTPQKGGGYFHLVRQVDAAGQVLTRPESLPAQTDILPIIRHVMHCVHQADADPANDRDHETLPEKYTLGPMLLGSEVWDRTRGVITMDRSVDMECIAKTHAPRAR